MALDFVPVEHLSHLVDRLPQADQEQAKEFLSIPDGRDQLLPILERMEPGVGRRLNRSWPFISRKAIHLWECPQMDNQTPETVRIRLEKALGINIADGTPRDIDRTPGGPEDRIARVELNGDELRIKVHVSIPRYVPLDSDEEFTTIPSFTAAVVSYSFENKLFMGYASFMYARRALMAVLKTLFDKTPPKGSDRWSRDWMVAVGFTEAHVAKFTDTHKMGMFDIKGPDPEGKCESLEYEAKVVQGEEVPLSGAADGRIAAQLRQENYHRVYCFTFTHTDEFVEECRVRFILLPRPHLSFITKTSRDAMEWLTDTLVMFVHGRQVNHVRPQPIPLA